MTSVDVVELLLVDAKRLSRGRLIQNNDLRSVLEVYHYFLKGTKYPSAVMRRYYYYYYYG